MAFFSSNTGNNRRSGWLPNSFLSPLNSKPKLPRKSRRKTSLLDFILFPNFFIISLIISLLFFILVFFLIGIPNPLSSHSNHKHSPFHKPRKPFNRKPILFPNIASSATVDITTKDLYDKIQFLDVNEGSPREQGWKVGYNGNEWDTEKLKVFVVPHSHNDPGWRMTVDEYYEQKSRHILDTIVESLSKDGRRKFIWEEISFLEKWWRDSSTTKRELLINLVKNGQLEIVGGGWVMNDEANSHYFGIIEQMTEGNMWLNSTIGVVPRNAWAIDPFGYSPTMAYLLRRMGFQNMVIQRTHYELKKELAFQKNLEYIWRQSWDSEENTDIFVHMMPFYSYDISHSCGPDPAICCQFDFARMRTFIYELCPWGKYPVETDQDNLQDRALKLLDQYRKKSTLYRTNTLLVPLGDDFRYINIDEAEAQFRNYQLLFDYMNSNEDLKVEAKFGTLEDYFRALRDEAERVNYSRPGEVGSGHLEGFPSLSGDFFTYSDRKQDYWSGYYVSRPFFKAVDRVLEQTLRASEMMIALLLGYCQKPSCEKLPTSFSYKLAAARRNLALFQHHDGVTGTAKDEVVEDYGTRMHISLQDLQVFMSKGIEVLLGFQHEKSDQNPSIFEPELVRSRYNVQPVHRVINVPDRSAYTIVLFNPLEHTRDEIVMVIVNRPDVSVLGPKRVCVRSQVSPELGHDKDKIFTGKHRLFWQASIPPLGLQTYYIVHGYAKCEKAKPAKLKISMDQLPCPTPYDCSKLEGSITKISNKHQALTFDVHHGLLQKVRNEDGIETVVGEEIGMYSSSGSGAYLFKPNGEAQSIIQARSVMVVSEGSLMQEVHCYPNTTWDKSPISLSTRIYNGDNTIQDFVIEKEYHVELLGEDFNDKELIARYKTDLDNKRIFYTDLNGFQMSQRETYDKIPLQGNYYPMPSLSFMQSSLGTRLSVHSRQSLGVASLKDGWLEIMLDRRLVKDDGRGLGQGVKDNRPMDMVFHILFESSISTLHPVSTSLPLNPSLLSHRIGTSLNYPLHIFVAKKPQDVSKRSTPKSLSPLTAPFPCDLHIVGLKVPNLLKYSQAQQPLQDSRFALILRKQQIDSAYSWKGGSQCKSITDEPINMFDMFKDFEVLNVKSTSLNLLHDDSELLGYIEQSGDAAREGHILISPMEIQAYKLDLRPHR